jgi:hypothetical protein
MQINNRVACEVVGKNQQIGNLQKQNYPYDDDDDDDDDDDGVMMVMITLQYDDKGGRITFFCKMCVLIVNNTINYSHYSCNYYNCFEVFKKASGQALSFK